MDSAPTKVVLMPGLDGTGALFEKFVSNLPKEIEVTRIRYPVNLSQGYPELMLILQDSLPKSGKFVLLAESFSTPLAIQFAATLPTNLKALILCAGFVISPVHGWRQLALRLSSKLLFRLPMPRFLIKWLLLGSEASPALVSAVKAAIRSVAPLVLRKRLSEVLSCDVRLAWESIRVPVLYLQPTHDRPVKADCAEMMQTLRPETMAERIDDPHLILQSRPERAAAIIMKFLARLG